MFSILSHQGNASQKNTEIPPDPSQNGYYQENKKQMFARMWDKKDTYSLLVGVKIHAATVEISIEVLQKT
jgi:hypothetical protein